MSTSSPTHSGDPFPEGVDLALARACDGEELPDDGAGQAWREVPRDLVAALYREADAELMVEATIPTPEWSDARLVEALAAAERASRASTARGLRLAAELAARRPASSDAPTETGLSRYALDEIAVATGLARGAVCARVAEAQVFATRLPRMLDAMEVGLVALPGLRKVSELTWGLTEHGCRVVERHVLDALGRPHVRRLGGVGLAGMFALDPEVIRSVATRATTLQVGRLTRDAIAAHEPERVETEGVQERRQRRVGLDLARDGMAWLTAYGPDALAVAAFEKVDGLAHALDDPDDERTLDQKRSDVFFDLLLGRAGHAPGDPTGGDVPSDGSLQAGPRGWGAAPVNLDVLVDHTRCVPGTGCVGEAGRLGPVTAASLAELLELTQQTGGQVSGAHALPETCPGEDHHRAHGPGPYEPRPALRRSVRAHWRRCGFPGCSRRARWSDLDHATPHGRGGATCACNLEPLCRRHHLLKHDRPTDWPAWQLVKAGDVLTWTSPTGLAVHVTPDPAEGVPDPPGEPPPY